ncbi:SDR family oxidoreductase [Nocardioides mangrovicus]|uniref:SDR family oxidoreductase n=1 Tax=Nocardioides mangrovicus TaxID=2478913 RepID=A0A3L8P2X1_9ACTN|nr:SDR family oxidoreductase [Nocardioides mangrovicus]RLV49766.1 SDR family oxidoreductase [Nocardioides mangrovicus]
MDLGLRDIVAFVVGGTGLIGEATARLLQEEGATVVVGARSEDSLARVAGELGVETVVVDTAEQASVDAAVASVNERFGTIGVLVNTAAPSAQTLDPGRSSDPEQVVEGLQGKAMGYLRMTNAVLPQMREAGYGRVVQVNGQNMYVTGSITGTVRNAGVAIAAKALADQVAGTGVTINVVNPGPVREDASPRTERGVPGDSTPEQVATVVVLLCSRGVAAVSGEFVSVGHKLPGLVGY